jgi:hypothetical protein
VSLLDQLAARRKRDGTARVEKAEVADFHETVRQDLLEEAADKCHDIELGGAEACTPHFPVGERARTVCEAHEAGVGDGHRKAIRSEIGEGSVAMVIGLTVNVPGDGPNLRIHLLQQTGMVRYPLKAGQQGVGRVR